MRLGIMQPYFFPYIGYFQLMKTVDKYVVYDDVSYIKGGWVNRNNFIVAGDKRMITIALNGASPNRLINEIEIKDDFCKFKKSIQLNYSKAPYYGEVMCLLETICSFENRNLASFLYNSFQKLLSYLKIQTELIFSSSLNKACELRGQRRIVEICELLNADTYINAIGGQDLYNKEVFFANNINLYFLQSEIIPYQQFGNEFLSSLSIIDVMMFNSPKEVSEMLDKFKLI